MRSIALAMSTVLLAGSLSGQDRDDKSKPETEKEIDAILQAKYAHATARGYAALFKRVGPDGVRALKNHKHPQIAIRAAWEEIRLTLPEKNQARVVQVDPHRLHRFLGFLEGRLAVSVPEWWQDAVVGAKAHHRNNVYFGFPPIDRDVGEGFWGPPGTSVAKQDGRLLLKAGTESVPLPAAVPESPLYMHASASFTADACYLANHSFCGMGYTLFRLDSASGRVLWEASVWADGVIDGYDGVHFHRVSVVVEARRVMVFGASSAGIYVEAFNTKDGDVLFRFSSVY